jgi:hypothetical protein
VGGLLRVIVNSTGARVAEHTFRRPVPIVARIEWADDESGSTPSRSFGAAATSSTSGMSGTGCGRTATWCHIEDRRNP